MTVIHDLAPNRAFKSYIRFVVLLVLLAAGVSGEQDSRNLTPRQFEIQKQQQRLSSTEVEERRDAVMKLGAMRHPDAARVVLSALSDQSAIVRATAAKAILALPASETVSPLTSLLADRDEFVRKEAAYALGSTRSRAAVQPLTELLATDKKDGVRAAAAVALGEIADESAVIPLVQVISGQPVSASSGKGKSRREKNEFVLRAAAVGLGSIGSRTAVPALVQVLGDAKAAADVKREVARALGLIGDPAAVPALQSARAGGDPHLARTAAEALAKINLAADTRR
jgi:HEAT repeat protein